MDRRSIKRARARKRNRKILLSAFIILLIFVAGAAGYVWYTGKNVDVANMPEPLEFKPKAEIEHVEQAENVPQGASIQSITSTLIPGSNASVIVKTNTKSTCGISVIYDKIASKDSGLIDKESDRYGSISWSWTIDQSAPIGRWPVKITCFRTANPEVSAVVIGYIDVVSEILTDEE